MVVVLTLYLLYILLKYYFKTVLIQTAPLRSERKRIQSVRHMEIFCTWKKQLNNKWGNYFIPNLNILQRLRKISSLYY